MNLFPVTTTKGIIILLLTQSKRGIENYEGINFRFYNAYIICYHDRQFQKCDIEGVIQSEMSYM